VNITVENLAPCKKLLRVEVDAKTVDEAFEAITKDFQKQAALPGFRPGKAPRALVLKKYEADIKDEVKRKLIGDHYRKALEIHPRFSEACNNLGEALAGKGADKEAIVQFEKAVRLDPGFTVARENLGMVLARTGQTDKAIEHMKKVIEEKPDAPEAHRNLGHALATKGAFKEASAHLEEAVRLSGRRDPLALFLLGRVSADQGRRQEAVQYEQEALSIATRQNNAALVQAISAHLRELLATR